MLVGENLVKGASVYNSRLSPLVRACGGNEAYFSQTHLGMFSLRFSRLSVILKMILRPRRVVPI